MTSTQTARQRAEKFIEYAIKSTDKGCWLDDAMIDSFAGLEGCDSRSEWQDIASQLLDSPIRADLGIPEFAWTAQDPATDDYAGHDLQILVPGTDLYLTDSCDWKRDSTNRTATGREAAICYAEAIIQRLDHINATFTATLFPR